jgi:hypothetical protein
MEKLKYVSPEYQAQLDRLAETLCTRERFAPTIGQLALFDNVVELFPVVVTPGPEAA